MYTAFLKQKTDYTKKDVIFRKILKEKKKKDLNKILNLSKTEVTMLPGIRRSHIYAALC